MAATGAQPFLVRFYDPNISERDSRGRTLNQIIGWNDQKLEWSHDYIQTLFPLPEGSLFNWDVPLIDEPTFEAFRSRSDLRDSLRRSLTRMLSFYGFELNSSSGKPEVDLKADHEARFRNWVMRSNHNHLRITRIIRSLRVLGLEAEARAFFEALEEVYETGLGRSRIGPTSMMYWTRAAERPLYLAPDEDDDDATEGPDFLCQLYFKSEGDDRESSGAEDATQSEETAPDPTHSGTDAHDAKR